jgi:acyl-CoA synthetase (AMP-forming)/AMP-acid ligase II
LQTGIQYNCTSFVYVGEICRFLVNQPPSDLDRQHKIRFAFGNGMRRNVWEDFNKRFGIKCVEFYGASEGNCSMANYVSKLGRYCLFLKFSEKCPTSIYYLIVYLFLKSY